MKRKTGADYIDMVTEPGPVRILDLQEPAPLLESVKNRLDISVRKHGASFIGIFGHHDCAGNPLPREAQEPQVRESVRRVAGWFPEAEVRGYWIDHHWEVYPVEEF